MSSGVILIQSVDKKASTSYLNPADAVIVQDIDTKVPIGSLKDIVSKRLQKYDLSKHDIYLQDFLLDPAATLYDQGIKKKGIVELSIQVQSNEENRKLIIVEISEPPSSSTRVIPVVSQDSISRKRKRTVENLSKQNGLEKSDDLSMPGNPMLWTESQVHLWMVWVAKEFSLDTTSIEDYHVDGTKLCSMTESDFSTKFPFGDLLYSHLELLKKLSNNCSTINDATSTPSSTPNSEQINYSAISNADPVSSADDASKSSPSHKRVGAINDKSSTNKSSSGGQIQLWQFLLEMLTDADCQPYISWVNDDGEFKFTNPHMVAHMWGERKNKPAMNYEKLSRALRYYYEGAIIAKVPGKRFVYKFVCNLKELTGFDAAQLKKYVTECAERRKTRNVDEYLHTPKDGDVKIMLGSP